VNTSKIDSYNRLRDNAILAYTNCRNSGSKWGVQYWGNVLLALERKFNRVN